MRILITGAAGFVGRALVARLAPDHVIVALDFDTSTLAPSDNVVRVNGDLHDKEVRTRALANGCDALIHLATVPGGAEEADPAASRRINIDAMYDLLEEVRGIASRPVRVVYASSIAVFGDPMPANGVDDQTPLTPRLVYGGHKAMMETAVAMMTHRGEIDGVTVRLPGILARPKGPSGMKSAFISDLFHALREERHFTCPVSPKATIWAESAACCAANLQHALTLDSASMPRTRAVTLPALRMRMDDLAEEIAHQCGVDLDLIDYAPDSGLEAAFGAHPLLQTANAERAGFRSDGDLPMLVRRALQGIGDHADRRISE